MLETEADYARFDIDRKAANLLTVVDGRLTRITRNVPPSAAAEAHKRKERNEQAATANMFGATDGEAFGAGGLGLSGVGEGGGGRGEGIGLGAVGAIGDDSPPPAAPAASAPRSARDEALDLASNLGSAQGAALASAAPAPPPPAPPAVAQARGSHATQDFDFGRSGPAPVRARPQERAKMPPPVAPYTGKFADIMNLIRDGQKATAIALAHRWHGEEPGDVMALVALGEAYEANGYLVTASRAYGSIIDLFAARADLRRFAGERLEHLAEKAGLELAIDSYEKAAIDRPDHPASHRLLAFAQLKNGHYQESFDALARGLKQRYPEDRFRGVVKILREDLGLVGAAWTRAEPTRSNEIREKVTNAGGVTENAPSLRFVLNWETDANDVDFHISDASGGHAYYGQPNLPSGGNLYADVTTGYGPECFTIRGPKAARSSMYTLQAHDYSRGPMGYGMGKLQIIDHDGSGGLTFEERPYVVMVDHAYLDLGKVKR